MKTEEIEIIEEEHKATSDEKIKWFGYGEWVEEIDFLTFKYKNYECLILRNMIEEPYAKELYMSGGHLCGYVNIPKEHKYHGKHYDDIEIDCHGSLTFFDTDKYDKYWIGFDCAHSTDYCPSIELFKKNCEEIKKFIEKFPFPKVFEKLALFNPTYKNINFCIEECKSIVDQLIGKQGEF